MNKFSSPQINEVVRLSMMAIGVYRSFGFVVAYYDENNIDDIWLQWRHETN